MISRNIILRNQKEVMEFVDMVQQYPYAVEVSLGKDKMDAKSVLGMLALGFNRVMRMEVSAEHAEDLLEAVASSSARSLGRQFNSICTLKCKNTQFGGKYMEDDKQLLVEKYRLKHENHAWYSESENAHKHLIFKDAFFERADIIGLLFRINKLCIAKVKYFRKNIEKYEPLKYNYKKGFVAVPLWDADFLRHRGSGLILDFRYLQTITVYDDFKALCGELESYETTEP